VVVVANGGTVEGVVKLTGPPPALAPIKVTKNQDYCGVTIPNPTYEVASGGGLKNVLVYLKDISKGKAPLAAPITLLNEHCMFAPRVQGATVGQKITISSNDPILTTRIRRIASRTRPSTTSHCRSRVSRHQAAPGQFAAHQSQVRRA